MFPKNFKIGFSEAGFQFEMGLTGKDENTDWFKWSHDQSNVEKHMVSGDNPEDGAAYWELYRKDHDMAQYIGMNAARIGTEWSRIFPKSTEHIPVEIKENNNDILDIKITNETIHQLEASCDQEAVNHYMEIFKDIKGRGWYLVINLFHWSLPLWINDPERREKSEEGSIGNCFDKKTVVEFSKYAAFMAYKFGDLADRFATMNEPNEVFKTCSDDKRVESYHIRMKYFIEAHARAYDVMRNFTKKEIGIIYANGDVQSLNNEDPALKNEVEYEQRYSFFDALLKGDVSWYTNACRRKNIIHGENQRDDLKGRMDWIGVNYYSRNVVKRTEKGYENVKGLGYDTGWISYEKSLDGRSVTETGWEIYPEGIYNVLMSYHNRYHLPMMITENGMADDNDILRPRYLVSHLSNIERAIEDGARVEGYFHWALTDNFEWGSGFSKKFGLLKIDYSSKRRYYRPSALVLKEITKYGGIPPELEWMIQDKF
ncbi:MAG: beta-galactosidase BgaS [Cuniculiplasma sp.]